MAVVLSVVGKFDGKDLDRAQAALNKLKKEAGESGLSLAKIGQGFKDAGRSMTDFGKSMTTKVTLPLLAVGAGIGKAIQSAADLAETQSKVGQIFGDSADEIEKWASGAATALGQSKQQAMDAASTFATFGKSAGISGEHLATFSTDLAGLATDLASFNNTSPEEAITAIGAALRGENEPIRKYGVLLDDASLRQEALRQGLIKTTKEALTPQQKVLAAQALIVKQTTTAQGDFARTSDGLANQQRILKAQLSNTTAELGQAFLPIALQVATFIQEKIVPAIQKFVDWFGGLSEKTKVVILIVGAAIAALGPLITIIGTLTTAIGFLISPIGLAVVAIAALVAGAIYAYNKFEGFRKVVDATFRAIKTAAIAVYEWLKENWRTIIDIITKPFQVIVGFIQRHWDSIEQIFRGAFKVIKGIFDVFAGIFTGDWSRVWNGLKGIVSGAASGLLGYLKTFVGLIVDSFKDLPKKMLEIGKWIVEGIWNGMKSLGGWLMDQIKDWAGSIVDGIKGFFGIGSPSKITTDYGRFIAQGLAVGMQEETGKVSKAADKMGSAATKALKKQADAAKKAFQKLKDDAAKGFDAIKGRAKDVVSFAGEISSSLLGVGSVAGFDTGALQQAIDEAASIDEQLTAQAEAVNEAMGAIWEARASTAEDKAGRIAAAEKRLGAEQQKYFDLSVARGKAQQKINSSNYTAKNIIADMSTRLATIRHFGQSLQKLKDLGLNNASLQEIISAGPKDGAIIADALLSEGIGAISQVNDLESQLANVASSIGDIGASSEFGTTSGQAQQILNSTITVSPGSVVVNISGEVSATDKASIATAIQTEVGKAMVTVLDQAQTDAQDLMAGAFMALGQAATTAKKSTKRKR